MYDKYRNGETILVDNVETAVLELGEIAFGAEADVNLKAKASTALTGTEVPEDETIRQNYRYFSSEYIGKLGIEGITQDFLLNIKSRKVVSYEGIKYEGQRYYTLEQITENTYNVEYKENESIPTFETSVSQLENDKWKISINNIQYEGYIEKWQVKYQKEGWDYWAESDSLEFIVNEVGYYNIYINNKDISSELYEKIEVGEFVVVGEKVTGKNKTYTKNGTAKIPVGFAIVPGCDDVSQGLVISDVENDTENIGNQFVWIPVTEDNPFEIRASYENGNIQASTDFGEADSTGVNTNSNITENATTVSEAKALYLSVQTNGGFYIGRYEAGKDSSDNVVCKKGAIAYGGSEWGNLTTELGGATELARNFASSKNYDTDRIHTTLCYGVQWDTALNFIDPGYTEYAKSSSGMGWYSDNYSSITNGNTESNPEHITGKDLIYSSDETVIANKHKNIYDMGGNFLEWTMESYSTTKRVLRGGAYYNNASNNPASYRFTWSQADHSLEFGFRIALYL